MVQILIGIFLILHGLVHLLYTGQSWGLFKLRPGMIWPDGTWLLSRFLKTEMIRTLAAIGLVFASIGLITSAVGIFLEVGWWQYAAIASAGFSSLLFFVMWNGKFQGLDDQGGVGVLINLAILAIAWILY